MTFLSHSLEWVAWRGGRAGFGLYHLAAHHSPFKNTLCGKDIPATPLARVTRVPAHIAPKPRCSVCEHVAREQQLDAGVPTSVGLALLK